MACQAQVVIARPGPWDLLLIGVEVGMIFTEMFTIWVSLKLDGNIRWLHNIYFWYVYIYIIIIYLPSI